MKTTLKKRKGILKNNRGQGATEYILLLVAVVAIVVLFKGQIKQQVEKIIGQLSGKINDATSN